MRWTDVDKTSVSRREERHPQGWLGQAGRDVGDVSDRGWNQPDEPDAWSLIGKP